MLSKRGILVKLVKIYDFLGFVLFEIFSGKFIYCVVCDMKGVWDENLLCDFVNLWVKWESRLLEWFIVLRLLVVY